MWRLLVLRKGRPVHECRGSFVEMREAMRIWHQDLWPGWELKLENEGGENETEKT